MNQYAQQSQYAGFWDALNVFLNPAAAIAQGANAPPIIEGALSPIQTLVGEQDVMTQGFQQNNQTLQAITGSTSGGLDRNNVPQRFNRERGGLGMRRRFEQFLADRRGAPSGSGSRSVQGSNFTVGRGFFTPGGGGTASGGGGLQLQAPRRPLGIRGGGASAPGTPWGLILGGVALLALVGGGVYFFATRKRRRR